MAAAVVVALPSGDALAVPPTETCEPETYAWNGSATLGPADAVDTGLVVAPILGSTLRVVGTSADGLDAAGYATPLQVWVGESPATAGAVVHGGRIVLQSNGTSVTVSGATVVVDRCALVAVAAAPIGVGDLPATGTSSTWPMAVIAAMVAGLGLAMVRLAQRATAGGRGPGSPPDAAPPAPR